MVARGKRYMLLSPIELQVHYSTKFIAPDTSMEHQPEHLHQQL
jgi:hypothetical protein